MTEAVDSAHLSLAVLQLGTYCRLIGILDCWKISSHIGFAKQISAVASQFIK